MTKTDGATGRQGHWAALARGAALALPIAVLSGCASTPVSKGPDKVTIELLNSTKEALFEKGKAYIDKKNYELGRKYLSYVFETYPNDPLGREALLMVADAYFKQGGTSAYTEARFRYRDYLNRYPGAPRRDYARYQFAYCSDKEHATADRDQTSTREALDQYRVLIKEFPDSGYAGAARERIRVLTDNLAEHEFQIGYFYLRKGAPGAAEGRFAALEAHFPDYGAKDKLFFYSAEALKKLGRTDEASRYLSRIVEEYPDGIWAKKARKKGAAPRPAATASVDNKPKTP